MIWFTWTNETHLCPHCLPTEFSTLHLPLLIPIDIKSQRQYILSTTGVIKLIPSMEPGKTGDLLTRAKALWRKATDKVSTLRSHEEYLKRAQKDECGCIKVVETNFDDVVVRNNRDVLIVFYTPEVLVDNTLFSNDKGKSKPNPLKDVLQRLVNTYQDAQNVTIASCDVAENDVPVEVYHIPTIKLYPAGKKRLPVEYFGKEDDVEQYKSFIRDEGCTMEKPKPTPSRSLSPKHANDGSAEKRLTPTRPTI